MLECSAGVWAHSQAHILNQGFPSPGPQGVPSPRNNPFLAPTAFEACGTLTDGGCVVRVAVFRVAQWPGVLALEGGPELILAGGVEFHARIDWLAAPRADLGVKRQRLVAVCGAQQEGQSPSWHGVGAPSRAWRQECLAVLGWCYCEAACPCQLALSAASASNSPGCSVSHPSAVPCCCSPPHAAHPHGSRPQTGSAVMQHQRCRP